MVIARSIVVDLTAGARMVRAMNIVAGVAGIAPVVGPLLGAAILQFSTGECRSGSSPRSPP